MDDVAFRLKKILSLYEESRGWPDYGRLAAYAAISVQIDQLEAYADHEDARDSFYASEKLNHLRRWVDTLFGMVPDDGHDSSQHHVWLLEALQGVGQGLVGETALS